MYIVLPTYLSVPTYLGRQVRILTVLRTWVPWVARKDEKTKPPTTQRPGILDHAQPGSLPCPGEGGREGLRQRFGAALRSAVQCVQGRAALRSEARPGIISSTGYPETIAQFAETRRRPCRRPCPDGPHFVRTGFEKGTRFTSLQRRLPNRGPIMSDIPWPTSPPLSL
ncbi:hypothetical protein LX32DRAFT_349122 [Colletotrichum zoysiae]|uniref:Uncharacterized protein n=1 Tax=Colletotrichum zoysiae TaxID=1216348 RepID=A0AAD9M1U9_9PEZI|nr:hypothetical protein LX32DRAFT_349122 [Colletotrichum zoysiae]